MKHGSVPTKDAKGRGYKTKLGIRSRIMVTLSDNLFQQIKKMAVENRRSISKQISFMIRGYKARNNK